MSAHKVFGVIVFAGALLLPQQGEMFQMLVPDTRLFLTNEPEYSDNGMSPDAGTAETDFTFRIRYAQNYGWWPSYMKVCWGVNRPHEHCQSMSIVGGERYPSIGDGVIAQTTLRFPGPGTYKYYFTARDTGGWATVGVPSQYGQQYFTVNISGPPPTAVAFVPGLEGSRLYMDGTLGENQLWEPNRNEDVKKLFLDENGSPIYPGIYTRDIVDEAFTVNIYKSFGQFMDGLVSDRTITAWKALPYDWRRDVSDPVPAMAEEIATLAANANNGKVTIVAHSNGGLVAKELLKYLQEKHDRGESDLINSIDKLVLVAVPQLGTPKAAAGLLHGYGQVLGGGWLMNESVARTLAEHMRSAFTLLPADNYFSRVLDPVIRFDSSADQFAPFMEQYGAAIDTPAELRKFLAGDNGARPEPDNNDTVAPNVLGSGFLDAADATQADLADWIPPENIKVTQVAGWGLDTVRTVEYYAKRTWSCGNTSAQFCHDGYTLDLRPVFTSDGDDTVVTPSATGMGEDTLYLNLYESNKGITYNRAHGDILEVDSLLQLIRNLITQNDTLPIYVTRTKPMPQNEDKKLRISVHSPVSIGIYDEYNNHTGPITNPNPHSDIQLKEENIANSYYLEMGEGKYLGADEGYPYTLSLKGTGLGTFTLDIEEAAADTVVNAKHYKNIPVTEKAAAELRINTDGSAGPLQLDVDGDGTTDASLDADTKLSPSARLDLLLRAIDTTNLRHGPRQSIESQIKNMKKSLEKGKIQPAAEHLSNIEEIIRKEAGGLISEDQANGLYAIINSIRELLNI